MRFLKTLLFAIAALALPAAANAVAVKNLDMGPNVQVWYVEDHTLPMISMTAALPAGSAYDPAKKPGLANFTADLLNEGAGNLDSQAYQTALSNRAIRMSISPERDYLVISILTLSENAKEAFRLLGLALTRPRFDAEAISRVRAQLVAAIREEDEDPSAVAAKGFFGTFFKGHPYGHPVSGDLNSVAHIDRNDLRSFARSHWVRNGLRISVSGDADAETLKMLIGSAFGQLPSRWPPAVPPVKHMGAPGMHLIPMPVPQPTAIFAVPGLLRSDRDFIPGYVANYILGGGGFSSRLTQEVREKRGLTYGVSTAMESFRKAGIVVGQVATRAGAMRQTIDVVRATMRDMVANGPTDKELADAKTYLTGSFPLAFSSNVGIASQLNAFQRSGLPIGYVEKRNALINAVTAADVKRVATRLFQPAKLTIVIGGSLQAPSAPARPLPGADKPAAPAMPPAKPLAPKTTAPGPKPTISSTTAAKPKEQPKTPSVAPTSSPRHH